MALAPDRTVALLVLALCAPVAGCAPRSLPLCTAENIYTADPVSQQDASAYRPVASERACFARTLRTQRCWPLDVLTLPEGRFLHQVEPHVWLVVEGGGSTCCEPQLDRALHDCDVHDLALVVPWRGDCRTATREYQDAVTGRAEVVSGPTARVVLLARTLGLRRVHRDVVERLTEIHASRPPQQGELLLHSITQRCQDGAASPWIGRVRIDLIAATIWTR